MGIRDMRNLIKWEGIVSNQGLGQWTSTADVSLKGYETLSLWSIKTPLYPSWSHLLTILLFIIITFKQSSIHLVRHFTMQLTSLVLLFTASVALAAPGFVEDRAAAAECGRLCGVRILIPTPWDCWTTDLTSTRNVKRMNVKSAMTFSKLQRDRYLSSLTWS